jgi:light-regulated signal transduction histidine kinase (bacteriophytochrome)
VFIDLFQMCEQVRQQAAQLQAANQELARQASELQAVNKELEAFSYSVSHDLRAPLRAIDGFSRILLEEHAPQLSDEAQRYLHLVRNNTQQMGHLVDDLLTFSRLGRQSLSKQPVAVATLVWQVLDDLSAEQQGRRVEIAIGELPTCQADQHCSSRSG